MYFKTTYYYKDLKRRKKSLRILHNIDIKNILKKK